MTASTRTAETKCGQPSISDTDGDVYRYAYNSRRKVTMIADDVTSTALTVWLCEARGKNVDDVE